MTYNLKPGDFWYDLDNPRLNGFVLHTVQGERPECVLMHGHIYTTWIEAAKSVRFGWRLCGSSPNGLLIMVRK